jgi:hypothetical protein
MGPGAGLGDVEKKKSHPYWLESNWVLSALRPLISLLCQPRVIVKMIVEKQTECRLAGESEVLGGNLTQRHFGPAQNPT